MKRKLFQPSFFIILVVASYNVTHAQSLSLTVGGGYHLGVGKQNLTHHDFSSFITTNPWPWEKLDVSLGEGAMLDGAVQYQFDQNFGVDLSASYLFGAQHTSKLSNNGIVYKRQIRSQMLRVGPGFLFSVPKGQATIYARIGMVFGFGYIDYNQENDYNQSLNRFSYRYQKGISLGASSSFGITYNMKNRISIFGEFRFVSQSYAPKRGILTERISNGMPVEVDNTFSTEIEFVDEIATDPTIVINPNEPLKQPKYSYPVNGFGLNIGVKYRLWQADK